MRKLHCSDEMMVAACAEIAAGLTDADLGSNFVQVVLSKGGKVNIFCEMGMFVGC